MLLFSSDPPAPGRVALALLLPGKPNAEVQVEVAAARGRPGERPAHSPLVFLQLLKRGTRYRPMHHVMISQVNDKIVGTVRNRGA